MFNFCWYSQNVVCILNLQHISSETSYISSAEQPQVAGDDGIEQCRPGQSATLKQVILSPGPPH